MKIIVGVTVMLLLVSSCGLFKKSTSIKQSDTIKEVRATGLDLEKEGAIQANTKTDFQSVVMLNGQTITQVEGEDIKIATDGTVHMAKGKVNRKSSERSSEVKLQTAIAEKKLSVKEKTVLATNQQYAVSKKASTQVSRPSFSMLFWFCIGSVALILLGIWWIRKKLR